MNMTLIKQLRVSADAECICCLDVPATAEVTTRTSILLVALTALNVSRRWLRQAFVSLTACLVARRHSRVVSSDLVREERA